MSSFAELFSGILRFFPNTMIVTLFIVGIVTAKLSWIMIAIGGILLSIAVLTLQYLFGKVTGIGPIPGAAVMEACSLLPPISSTATYSAMPSLWMALASYFVTYIIVNATRVYTAKPVNSSNNSIAVQQRKGIGLISMLAAAILFIILVAARSRTSCETRIGGFLGAGAGVAMGWVWWQVLNACGSDVFPDIHGVMMGLQPGVLHTGPVACTPA